MALTRTPVVASSFPTDFVRAMTAAFDAEYAARFGLPSLPAMLAKLTIRPHPVCTIPGGERTDGVDDAETFTSRVRRHASDVVSRRGTLGPTIPAEFTRISIGPASAAARATAMSSVTSTCRSTGPATSSVMTSMPSARRRSAEAAPNPLAAPVTRPRFMCSSVLSGRGDVNLLQRSTDTRRSAQ